MRAIQNFIDRFTRKHSRIAIPNLMLYIIIGNIAVYLLDMFSNGYASQFFSFNRVAILQYFQVWRIFTFIFVPDTTSNIFFFAIHMYFFYFVGTTLEREQGSSRFTIYYLTGVILNIIVGFIVGYTSIYYINMALFFALATLFPNVQVLLFFIIPLKIKWLAWFNGAFFLFTIFELLTSPTPFYALLPIVAMLNYFLFFAGDLWDSISRQYRHTTPKQRPVNIQSAKEHVKEKQGYLHKCDICGRTDVTNPELSFRYCSKCKGFHCYCEDHINDHVHVE